MKFLLVILLVFQVSHAAMSQDKSYIFVFLNKNPDAEKLTKEESAKIMEGHMANINRLAKEGKLLAAGPFEGGGGIFVFATQSVDEAKEWLSTDPGVKAQRWSIELFPYTPRVGGICPVREPYEMILYSFVRFNAVVSKFNASTYPQIIQKHDAYLKQLAQTGNVVTEAIFGDHDGGILVMKGEVNREVFESDPGVQE